MIGCNMGSTRNSADITPAVKLFEKPFSEWTKKQRKWLDLVYKRVFVSRSPRGRKTESVYDSLFHEREMARLSDRRTAPSYTQLALRALNEEPSACSMDKEDVKQRFIRSYQRRKNALRLPDPPQN
jgi:hypothetical protein